MGLEIPKGGKALEVLVVDDSPVGGVRIAHLLSMVEAASFRVSHIRHLAPRESNGGCIAPDVVLLDEQPLLVEGLDALNRFREANPQCPIILLTRVNGDRLADRAAVDEHLLWEELGERMLGRSIRSVIERSRLIRELAEARRSLALQEGRLEELEQLLAQDPDAPLGDGMADRIASS